MSVCQAQAAPFGSAMGHRKIVAATTGSRPGSGRKCICHYANFTISRKRGLAQSLPALLCRRVTTVTKNYYIFFTFLGGKFIVTYSYSEMPSWTHRPPPATDKKRSVEKNCGKTSTYCVLVRLLLPYYHFLLHKFFYGSIVRNDCSSHRMAYNYLLAKK